MRGIPFHLHRTASALLTGRLLAGGLLAGGLLGGCVATTATRPLGSEPVASSGPAAVEAPDRQYRTVLLTFTGGQRALVHYRVYEKTGHAAMCAYVTVDGSAADRDVTGRWLQGSVLLLADREFGRGDFLRVVAPPGGSGVAGQAQCAESRIPWQPPLAMASIAFRSAAVRRAS